MYLGRNKLTSLPVEIWQLTSLRDLDLICNYLTSVPAEIGQLTSPETLWLSGYHLTSVPAEIGQLAALRELRLDCNPLSESHLDCNQLSELHPDCNQLTLAQLRKLEAAGCDVIHDQMDEIYDPEDE